MTMRMNLKQVQRLFDEDLTEALETLTSSHSPYFSMSTILDSLSKPPISIRCQLTPPSLRSTWVWVFAESEGGGGQRTGYLIGRAQKWPETHLEYGVASRTIEQRVPVIEVMGLDLKKALDWD